MEVCRHAEVERRTEDSVGDAATTTVSGLHAVAAPKYAVKARQNEAIMMRNIA
jgi:hypothetical protein